MYMLGLGLIARSPLVRLVAVAIADFLAAKGIIAAGDVSQVVEDMINIISFLGFIIYLAVWQWRSHHPAKAQIEVEVPTTPEDIKSHITAKERVNEAMKKVLDKFFETPQQ